MRVASRLARDFSLPIVFEMPRIIQAVPTNACNLRCRACPKTHYKTNVEHMSPEVYRKVRDEAYPTAESVCLQGLGEPTLAPLFGEMLEDAMRYDLHVDFVTNVSRLTPEHIRLLAQMRASVCVSLDGATAETHEASRVGSKFSQVLEVLDELREARQSRKDSQLTVLVNTVLTRRSVGELPDLIRLVDRYGVALLNVISPGVGDRQDGFALDAIGHHEDLFRAHVERIREAERTTRVKVSLPPYVAYPKPEEEARPESRSESRPAARRRGRIFPQKCFAAFREVYIDVDGWVRPCCVASGMAMGHILQDRLKKIWNNRHYRRFRRRVNSNNPPEPCRTCGLNSGICGGDERFLEKRYAQGLPPLSPPPRMGFSWSEKEQKVFEY